METVKSSRIPPDSPVNMNGKSGRTMYMDIAAGENMYSPDAHMLSEKMQ